MISKDKIIEKLKTVKDPELHLDIVKLGLLYGVKIKKDKVNVVMTFTTPFCPYGPALEELVKKAVMGIDGVGEVKVEITFNPPWDISKLTDEARAELGLD